MPASLRLYVYYRLDPARASVAQAAFDEARAGAAVELLQRPTLTDGLLTWMEVYPEALAGLEPRIAAALRPFVVGARHVEGFEPVTGLTRP